MKFKIYKIVNRMNLVSTNKLITNYIFSSIYPLIDVISYYNLTGYERILINTIQQKIQLKFFKEVIRVIELNIYV